MTTSSPVNGNGCDESHYQQFLHYLQPNNCGVEHLSSTVGKNDVIKQSNYNNTASCWNNNTSCNSSSLGFNSSSTGSNATGANITISPIINHSVPVATLPRRPPPTIPPPVEIVNVNDVLIMGKTSHHQRRPSPPTTITTSSMTRHDDSGLESV